jgi:glycosyltransferase involved in cell wall biosynthesis
MNRVLVFANDLLPLDGLPTSGGGLRSWQIIQGLAGRGFDVTYRMPLERHLTRGHEDVVLRCYRDLLWTAETQEAILDEVHPDVVVFLNPDQCHLVRRCTVPLAVDLHGPRLLETEYMARDAWTRAHGFSQKLRRLAEADFVTCAGERQRYYFIPYLLGAGVPLDEIEIACMPVALSPDLPQKRPDASCARFLFAGGFYPWQNPRRALTAVRDVLDETPRARLDIYGGAHGVSANDRAEFDGLMAALQSNPRAACHGYVSRDELLGVLARGTAAVELFERNIERELAFSTRTVEFLWAGLPVVYNNYSDLSDLIGRYEAGWCLDPADVEGLKRTLREIVAHPELALVRGANAQRLVRERLTWDRAIEPLAAFCANPRKRPRRKLYFRLAASRSPGVSVAERALAAWNVEGPAQFARRLPGRLARKLQHKRLESPVSVGDALAKDGGAVE